MIEICEWKNPEKLKRFFGNKKVEEIRAITI